MTNPRSANENAAVNTKAKKEVIIGRRAGSAAEKKEIVGFIRRAALFIFYFVYG